MKTADNNKPLKLGILGGGQLARMSAVAASQFGIETLIYCSEPLTSPAQQVVQKTTKGNFNELEKILDFAKECDVLTLENEFIDQAILSKIDELYPNKLFPNSKTFEKIGDKISEKNTFKNAGISIAPFVEVSSKEDILNFSKIHGFPLVLKSAKGGYDGYGNKTLKNETEIENALLHLKGPLLVEAFIPYEKELAIMVARNQSGEIKTYPIAHTMQENHICHFVSIPAKIDSNLSEKIISMSVLAMKAIDAVGIFAFEFFLTKNSDLYLNESAPRPHNSGHYSIEGCITSQFENHVRAVCNFPLGETQLLAKQVVMLNLLGTQNAPAFLSPINSFLNIKNGHLHLYGKINSKFGRKMGHFTLLSNEKNEEKLLEILKQLKEEYSL